jgi:hypothetical protein
MPKSLLRFATAFAVLAVAALIAIVLAALGVWDSHTTASAWERLGVPAMTEPFADLRSIFGALECRRQGLDVYAANPCDPWNRPFNYPPVWLALGATSLDMRAVDAAGVGLGILFVLGLAALFAEVRLRWIWFVIPAAFSPMTLLLVERGNTDALCWLLVLASVWLCGRRNSTSARAAGIVLAMFAAAIKFFPLASAVAIAASERARARPYRIAALLGLVAIAAQANRIPAIVANTGHANLYSYGYDVVFRAFVHASPLRTVLPAALLFGAATAAWFAARSSDFDLALADDRTSLFFLAGAGAFVGSFLLGTRWGYRAVFLLFCVPLLCDRLESERQTTSLHAAILLASTLGLLWCLNATARAVEAAALGFSWILFTALSAQILVEVRRTYRIRSMSSCTLPPGPTNAA